VAHDWYWYRMDGCDVVCSGTALFQRSMSSNSSYCPDPVQPSPMRKAQVTHDEPPPTESLRDLADSELNRMDGRGGGPIC